MLVRDLERGALRMGRGGGEETVEQGGRLDFTHALKTVWVRSYLRRGKYGRPGALVGYERFHGQCRLPDG